MSHFVHHYEENYLKELYKLGQKEIKKVNNTALAKALGLNPATVLEMVRKLNEKGLVDVLPDKTLQVTDSGKKQAVLIIRKHRLWEVFLVDKLGYRWSEVHDLAEQLEHVGNEELINRLEEYLAFPASDPHGDPIPDRHGKIKKSVSIALSEGIIDKTYQVVSFADTASSFLDYLSKLQIEPGTKLKIKEQLEYDSSFTLSLHKQTIQVSEKVATNIFVQPTT